MIKLFKTNIPVSFFITGVLTVIFSSQILTKDTAVILSFFAWYEHLFEFINKHVFLNAILSVGLVLLIGIILNTAFNKTSFYLKTTALSSVLYLLVLVTFKPIEFSLGLIIDLILAIFLVKVVDLDQNESAVHTSFIAGFIIGLAFIFTYWVIPLGAIVFLSISTFRPFIWREWIVGILGLSLPLIYVYCMIYIFTGTISFEILKPEITVNSISIIDWTAYSVFGVMILGSLYGLAKHYSTLTIVQRKQMNVLIQFLLLSLILSLVIYFYTGIGMLLFTVPLVSLLTIYVVNLKREKWFGLLFGLLLIVNLLRIFVD